MDEPGSQQPAGALDKADVLARFNGDAGLMREIIDVFLDVSPTLLTELRAAASGTTWWSSNAPPTPLRARWVTSASRRPWNRPWR